MLFNREFVNLEQDVETIAESNEQYICTWDMAL